MTNKIAHIGMVKFSSSENANGKVFFRIPLVATISKMTAQDYFEIGSRAFNIGNYGKAIKKFEKAKSLPFHPAPNNYGLIHVLGNAYFMKGEDVKAMDAYNALLAAPDEKNQIEGHWGLALLSRRTSGFSFCLEHSEKVLEYSRRNGFGQPISRIMEIVNSARNGLEKARKEYAKSFAYLNGREPNWLNTYRKPTGEWHGWD